MKVFISNNYGGEICKIKFEREKEKCFGFGVKISGFIETNSARIQHVTSLGKFVHDVLYFKIPRNIIPSFESKNFKVEYIADCTMVYKDIKDTIGFPIKICNGNIGDFNYQSPICMELEMAWEGEFVKNKETACRILLDQFQMNDDPLNYLVDVPKNQQKMDGSDLKKLLSEMFEAKCKTEAETSEKVEKIQTETEAPIFPEANVFRVRNEEISCQVMDDEGAVASVNYLKFIKEDGYLRIEYFRNIKNTKIEIWREDTVDDKLIDAENVYSVAFDSENCLSKIFEFKIDGFSLKTFAFEMAYVLKIFMDGSETAMPLTILSSDTIVSLVLE